MTVRLPDALHFPPQKEIISHLENHLLTNGSDPLYLKKSELYLNKRIIAAAALAFANQYKTVDGLKDWVWLTVRTLNQESELPAASIIQITSNLTWALHQCAKIEPGIISQPKVKKGPICR